LLCGLKKICGKQAAPFFYFHKNKNGKEFSKHEKDVGKVFGASELRTLHFAVCRVLQDGELTREQDEALGEIAEKIERIVPSLASAAETNDPLFCASLGYHF
jgi:hypothetical protein